MNEFNESNHPDRAPLRRYRVAAIQMVSEPDVAANLVVAGRLIGEAAAQGARLVALPEYFPLVGRSEQDKVGAREQDGAGPIQDFLSETAARHGVWIVGGTLPLVATTPDKVRNSCLVFDSRGQRIARYDKIHLFGFEHGTERYKESLTIEPGREVVAFDSPFGRVGLAVCYDLRFPELFRAMGAPDLVVVPAAFTEITGQAHWELLLRARAVENQCYVLAPAQGGEHSSGRLTHGDSMVIDPWGVVQARLAKGSGVVVAEIDLDHLATIRAKMPALTHRTLN